MWPYINIKKKPRTQRESGAAGAPRESGRPLLSRNIYYSILWELRRASPGLLLRLNPALRFWAWVMNGAGTRLDSSIIPRQQRQIREQICFFWRGGCFCFCAPSDGNGFFFAFGRSPLLFPPSASSFIGGRSPSCWHLGRGHTEVHAKSISSLTFPLGWPAPFTIDAAGEEIHPPFLLFMG